MELNEYVYTCICIYIYIYIYILILILILISIPSQGPVSYDMIRFSTCNVRGLEINVNNKNKKQILCKWGVQIRLGGSLAFVPRTVHLKLKKSSATVYSVVYSAMLYLLISSR